MLVAGRVAFGNSWGGYREAGQRAKISAWQKGKKMKKRSVFIFSVALMIFLFSGNVESFASEGMIYGCVNKDGKIRIVSDCRKCGQGEDCISWNKAEPSRQPSRRSYRSSGFRDNERYRTDPQGRNVYQPLP